jgi:hypothetical protein
MSNLGNPNNSMQAGCDMQYIDPTSDILDIVREITFRTALYVPTDASVNLTTSGNVNAWEELYSHVMLVEQVRKEIVFKSQYIYLFIAVAITLVATCCVTIILSGWWHLGRDVSLSPIEIARAFDAPLLKDSLPNADASALLPQAPGECASPIGHP